MSNGMLQVAQIKDWHSDVGAQVCSILQLGGPFMRDRMVLLVHTYPYEEGTGVEHRKAIDMHYTWHAQ